MGAGSCGTDSYLRRIDVDPASVGEPDLSTLTRLQRAHALSVPFETLSIGGDPHGENWGEGVAIDLETLHEKIVDRHRGGFCYELNGLFGWLLTELGFDVTRMAAMVLDDDGTARPPANHLANLVTLDGAYVVDVGMGAPRPRRPVPLDGTVVAGDDGVAWRVSESDRPDSDFVMQLREPGAEWDDRYVFTTTPRDLSYFEPTCDYLQTAPESPFTGDPVVVLSTPRGYRKLTPDRFVSVVDGECVDESISPERWYEVLESEFEVSGDSGVDP